MSGTGSGKWWVSPTLVFTGLLLLVVTLLGEFTSLGHYESREPRYWERFDPALVERTPDYDALVQEVRNRAVGEFDQLPPVEKMEILYAVVADRFTTGDVKHNIFSDWILWSLGWINPHISSIRDVRKMVSGGYTLLCGQSSYLLVTLANEMGVRARHVGLSGHVVMEAYYDEGWHMFDPDTEVIAKDESGHVVSVERLSNDLDLLQRSYPGIKSNTVPIIASKEDNSFASYPQGSWFVWSSQLLFLVEKATRFLKYLVPLFFLAVGVSLLIRREPLH